jgi:hypothetical protein
MANLQASKFITHSYLRVLLLLVQRIISEFGAGKNRREEIGSFLAPVRRLSILLRDAQILSLYIGPASGYCSRAPLLAVQPVQ